MLYEMINNPDLYVFVTYKDLYSFGIFVGSMVLVGNLISELILRFIRDVKKKK